MEYAHENTQLMHHKKVKKFWSKIKSYELDDNMRKLENRWRWKSEGEQSNSLMNNPTKYRTIAKQFKHTNFKFPK